MKDSTMGRGSRAVAGALALDGRLWRRRLELAAAGGATAPERRRRGDADRRSARARASSNLIAWAGYVEDGSTDPKVDWVSPFEKETGCQVNVKIGNTSDEMVTLMRTGNYDGVSASGDATLRLIAGGDVAPVNTDLVAELRRRLRRPEGPAVQLGRRRRCTASRTAAGRTC